jgi:hypothetical protein
MKHSLLLLLMAASTYASAQTPASTVTPTVKDAVVNVGSSTPEEPSFFSPKTEEDISALARVTEDESSSDLED